LHDATPIAPEAWIVLAASPLIAGDTRIAFSPFLCFGFWLTWLYSPIGLNYELIIYQ
jgi:hypothetical protein